jgi:hypothetical protein
MRIAHRSHSGSNAAFMISTTDGNFGETPEMAKKRLENSKPYKDSVNKAHADSIQRVKEETRLNIEKANKIIADSMAKVKSEMRKNKQKNKMKNKSI